MSQTSNYNTRPRPAEVLVEGTSAKLIRRRETMHDLLAPESSTKQRLLIVLELLWLPLPFWLSSPKTASRSYILRYSRRAASHQIGVPCHISILRCGHSRLRANRSSSCSATGHLTTPASQKRAGSKTATHRAAVPTPPAKSKPIHPVSKTLHTFDGDGGGTSTKRTSAQTC